jgi:hypothetical protein
MTKNIAHLYRDPASLALLSGLIGQPWGCVTGEIASKASGFTLFSWAEVIVEIGGVAWVLSSEMTELDFEGFTEEYPAFRVSADGSGLDAASAAGRVFTQRRGEVAEAISIVRETITRSIDGVEDWEFGTDYSVVFCLSKGAVCITKGGHHDEALFANLSEDVDSLQIPDRSIE